MSERKSIPPNPPRWQPNPDPASIEIPGLDTNASVHDQIEQIEQLITIKLQNIDENFSKIHNILANRILPAVKRYSVGTEPVREAAKFWTSFYEQAAQTRIPTYDDYSTVNEQPSEHTEQEEQEAAVEPSAHAQQESRSYDPGDQSRTSTENSFMPSHAAFSSTPATDRVAPLSSFGGSQTIDGIWAHSGTIDSSLVRLDREIQSLSMEDESYAEGSTAPNLSTVPDQSSRSFRDKGKGKDQSQPLLRNLLKQNLYSGNDSSSMDPSFHTSPLKPRGKLKTPIPKNHNPYLPPNVDPRDWSGVVDLRDPNVTTPHRSRGYGQTPSRGNPVTPPDESDDSWEGGLPPGMSPPVLMSPARPPRSSAELGLLKLGQTPTREAAARITRDLVSDIQKKGGLIRQPFAYGNSGVESSMSTVPTPPSLSRYRRKGYDTDPSSSSMDNSGMSTIANATADPPPMSTPYSRNAPAYPPYSEATVMPFFYNQAHCTPNQDLEDYSFSDDKVHSTAHPSAAFLMASARRTSSDDSLDSLDEEDQSNLDIAPIHPFDRIATDSYDDYDSSDEESYNVPSRQDEVSETLFGVRPNQQPGGSADGLRLHGLMFDDTASLSARVGSGLDNSPTPAHLDRL